MSILFSPFSFSNINLKNRVVMPPMATASIDPGGAKKNDGRPGASVAEHYKTRAENDVAMIIVEHTYISEKGKAHKKQLGIDKDELIPDFKKIANGIKSQGAVAVLQINHVGAAGDPSVVGHPILGPSDVPLPGAKNVPCPMTKQDIRETIDDFAKAAERAKKAGFNAVEIHAAHRYLITQFLSPLTNKRGDAYGGSLKARARFLLETIEAVRGQVGSQFPVFVRLGCTDGIKGGIEPFDAANTATMLEKEGVSLIDVSGALLGSEPKDPFPGYFAPAAALIKEKIRIPVMVTGGITEPSAAETILRKNQGDLVGIGRALLKDPKWVLKAKNAFLS